MPRSLALPLALLAFLSMEGCKGSSASRPASSSPPASASEESEPEAPKKAKKKAKKPEPDEDEAEERPKEAKASAPEPPKAPEPPPLPPVDFVEASPSAPPSKLPQLSIKAPSKNQVVPAGKAADLEVKLDLRSWPVSATGNRVHLVLDNRPARAVVDPKSPIKLRDLAPEGLSEGQHVLVALPVLPSGESVKPQGKKVPAAVVSFFVGKRDVRWKDTSPLLVYNTPRTGSAQDGSLLVDFYVLNAEIAEGRFVVHAAVSGPGFAKGESISSWKPWRVTNARPGAHFVKLELFKYGADLGESSSSTTVTYKSSKVPGPFAEVTRELKVEPPAAR